MVGVTVQSTILETTPPKGTIHVDDDDEPVTLRVKSTSDTVANNQKYLTAVPLNGRCLSDGEGIEQLETMLDADDFPDEFWHLQRDSFIHRSYNERLLALKNANDFPKRPISVPNDASFKRDSFIRQSFKSIRNSFSKSIRKKNGLKRSLTDTEDRNNNINSDNGAHSDKSGSKSDRVVPVDKGWLIENVLNLHSIRNKVGHSRNSSSSSLTSNR